MKNVALICVAALSVMATPAARAEIIASGSVQLAPGTDGRVTLPGAGTKVWLVLTWQDCFLGYHGAWMEGTITDATGGYTCSIDETTLTGFWQVDNITFNSVTGFSTVTAGEDTVHTSTGDYAISQSTITRSIESY